MKSIIEEIYVGNRGQAEQIKMSEEYCKEHDEMCKLTERLENLLDDEQKQLLSEIYNICGDLEAKAARTNYVEGFKLGVLIGKEVFGE